MIISHKYRFIFLKTNKTAGTSIEIALSRFCGPDDIITPISPEDEKTRKKLGYRGPQNYLSPIWDYGVSDIRKRLAKGKRKVRFFNHISAGGVKASIRKEVWDSYFKFCFERNPWDRVISLYYWRNKRFRSEMRPPISEFISSNVPLSLRKKGYKIYTIDGKVVVDRICKYEDIHEELETIRNQLGIPEPLELPMTKAGIRTDKRNYRDILGEGDKKRIAELFREEINLIGYEW